jgi:hypothetical protein
MTTFRDCTGCGLPLLHHITLAVDCVSELTDSQSAVQGSEGVSGFMVLAKIKMRSREPGVHQH